MIGANVKDIEDTVSSVTSSLLKRAKANDQDAWHALIEVHGDAVYNWCRRRGLDATTARDISQEVFKSVAASLDRFDRQRDSDSFRGWLYKITINKIRDHWRKTNKEPVASGGSDAQRAMHDIEFDGEEESAASDVKAQFLRMMEFVKGRFNETHVEAFCRVFLEGQDPGDVATDLGMARHNIYNIRSRILRELKREFGVESDGDGKADRKSESP